MTNSNPLSPADAIHLAVAHHQAGRVTQARAIYDQVLAADPTQFDALHLGGLAALQLGDPHEAIRLITRAVARNASIAAAHYHLGEAHRVVGALADAERCFRAAVALAPAHAEAHNSLAILCGMDGRPSEAIASFQKAIAARPNWGGAYFNLGLTLKGSGELGEALIAFHRGWQVDRASAEAAGQCVGTLAELVRGGLQTPDTVQYGGGVAHSFTVVFCSIDDVKCRNTIALYERLLQKVEHEIIVIRDARSLAEAYNRAAGQARGDIVILSHDDIDVLAADFAGRLADSLRSADIVGVIGGAKLAGPRWSSCGHPHLSGWITHREPSGTTYDVDLVSPLPRAMDLKLLDGVFLAARRHVLASVRFDESTFDGFHLYDLDWTYRAAEAGFRIATAGDLLVVHQSRGRFASEWQRYADRFCEKYSIEYVPPREPVKIYEQTLDSEDQVRRFFAQMMSLDNAAS